MFNCLVQGLDFHLEADGEPIKNSELQDDNQIHVLERLLCQQ